MSEKRRIYQRCCLIPVSNICNDAYTFFTWITDIAPNGVCAGRFCNQLVTGRDLRYGRALAIIQSQEYLLVVSDTNRTIALRHRFHIWNIFSYYQNVIFYLYFKIYFLCHTVSLNPTISVKFVTFVWSTWATGYKCHA